MMGCGELQWVHIPMAFALDLPTDGAAAAQRKQLPILPLSEETQSGRASGGLNTPQEDALTLFVGLMVKKMFGRSVSGPTEQ